MKNKVHKLRYVKLGETITDEQICDELIKTFNNADFGYLGDLAVADIINWLYSVKRRIK